MERGTDSISGTLAEEGKKELGRKRLGRNCQRMNWEKFLRQARPLWRFEETARRRVDRINGIARGREKAIKRGG